MGFAGNHRLSPPLSRKLTLMNPAYMLRQMMEDYPGLNGFAYAKRGK